MLEEDQSGPATPRGPDLLHHDPLAAGHGRITCGVKHLPGRPKTDKLDAAWLAKVAEGQLLCPSFVPPPEIRRLRDLTRYRTDPVRDPVRAHSDTDVRPARPSPRATRPRGPGVPVSRGGCDRPAAARWTCRVRAARARSRVVEPQQKTVRFWDCAAGRAGSIGS